MSDRALLAKMELTLSQFRFLMALKHHPETSQKSIADFWGIAEASASRQIEILLKKKMVARLKNSKNQKEYLLTLTEKGEKELKKALAVIDGILEKVFKDLANRERVILSSSLQNMLEFIRKEGIFPRSKKLKTNQKQ